MIAIIPIFLKNNDQIWRTPEGKELMLKSFMAPLESNELERLIVFTNTNSVIQLAKSLGIDSYLIDIDTEDNESELLPPGSHVSVKYLQETINLDFEELIILSFRNPLITSALIDKAIKKYKISEVPALISVKKSIDHPCQLNAYYKIVDIGLIHIFEPDEAVAPYLQTLDNHISTKHQTNHHSENLTSLLSSPDLRLTKSFYFDWKSRGIQEKGDSGIYCRICDDLDVKYISIDQVYNNTFKKISFPFWIYESHNMARVLLQLDTPEKLYSQVNGVENNLYLAGSAIPDDFNHAAALLFKNINNSSECFLALNSNDSTLHSCQLKVLPVGLSGPVEEKIVEIGLDDFSKPIPLQFEGKDVCGFIYWLLKPAQDDSYDLMEPFPPDERLWTGSIPKINVKTGREIMGRQDFPDVFEPEESFFLMRKNLIPTFDREVLNGNADGFVMDETDLMKISSELDLLRYQVITRANDNYRDK